WLLTPCSQPVAWAYGLRNAGHDAWQQGGAASPVPRGGHRLVRHPSLAGRLEELFTDTAVGRNWTNPAFDNGTKNGIWLYGFDMTLRF
ncbi:MAG TPA: hypothetical protein VGY77_01745, partial [Gemmataceae bacterium]|nr:hypothetical protein [Gemmataceae bacterium]